MNVAQAGKRYMPTNLIGIYQLTKFSMPHLTMNIFHNVPSNGISKKFTKSNEIQFFLEFVKDLRSSFNSFKQNLNCIKAQKRIIDVFISPVNALIKSMEENCALHKKKFLRKKMVQEISQEVLCVLHEKLFNTFFFFIERNVKDPIWGTFSDLNKVENAINFLEAI